MISLEQAQGFRVHELGERDILSELREYAARPDAKRRKWGFARRDEVGEDPTWGPWTAPNMSVYIGHQFGALEWSDHNSSYVAIGGANTKPAMYEVDEWASVALPAGAELPIDTVMSALERFIAAGGRPDVVQWERFNPADRETILKEQPANE